MTKEKYTFPFNETEIEVQLFHNWKNGFTCYCDEKDISLIIIQNTDGFIIYAIQFKDDLFYCKFLCDDYIMINN